MRLTDGLIGWRSGFPRWRGPRGRLHHPRARVRGSAAADRICPATRGVAFGL